MTTTMVTGDYGPGYGMSITGYGNTNWSHWPTTTYIPTVIDPRIGELIDELKKLRKELKKARRDGAAATD